LAWTNKDSHLDDNQGADEEWQDVTDDRQYNPPGIQQAWGSIPWDVPAPTQNPVPSRYPIFDPEISRSIREHDCNAIHNTRADNWKKIIPKLFSAYLWLKDKTANWTAPCSFDEFTSHFCKCQQSSPRVHQFIDLVGQSSSNSCRFSTLSLMLPDHNYRSAASQNQLLLLHASIGSTPEHWFSPKLSGQANSGFLYASPGVSQLRLAQL
jgi:hypothetical protein